MNIFEWLDFISSQLTTLASTEDAYIDLLLEVLTKVRRDMAQGPIIEALIKIGIDNPHLGVQLSEAMRKRGEEVLSLYSSQPLAGAGKTDLGAVEAILAGLLSSEEAIDRITALRAYRSIFGSKELGADSEFRQLLRRTVQDGDSGVRTETAIALLDTAKKDETDAREGLIALAKHDDAVRFVIADKLLVANVSPTLRMDLLAICAQSNNNDTLRAVGFALAQHGMEAPGDATKIILELEAGGRYNMIDSLRYAAQQIGKTRMEAALPVVERFILEQDSPLLKYTMDSLLSDLGSSNPAALAELLCLWLEKEAILREVSLRTLRLVLGSAYGRGDESIAGHVYPALLAFAEKKGIDTRKLKATADGKTVQSIELLSRVSQGHKRFDYKALESSWRQFPSMRSLLTDKWFEQKRKEDNADHPLIIYLAQFSEKPSIPAPIQESKDKGTQELVKAIAANELLFPDAFLKYFELMASRLADLPNLGNLKNRLRDDNQFVSAFSEMQLIHAFVKASFLSQIEPTLGNKQLDLAITIGDQRILIEVITPDVFPRLKYSAGVVGIPNRAGSKIYEEFKKHLADVSEVLDEPVIVVIDISGSEISYDSVADYLFGTLQFTFTLDKKTGDVVSVMPNRGRDSMHDLRSSEYNLDVVSGVLCYKTGLDNVGHIRISCTMFINPYAVNSISGEQASKLQGAIIESIK